MSIQTVRGAIAAYLNTGVGGSIPGLNKIYRGQPTWIDPTRWWELPAEAGTGTIGYLHLAKIDEDRIAEPAVTGAKFVEYVVALVLICRYKIPPDGTDGVAYEGDEWVDGQDVTIEAIKALIRADPTLGTSYNAPNPPGVIYDQFPSAIWQAGQSQGDLSMVADPPYLDEDGGEVLTFQVLEFHATECITA